MSDAISLSRSYVAAAGVKLQCQPDAGRQRNGDVHDLRFIFRLRQFSSSNHNCMRMGKRSFRGIQ